VFNPEDYVYKLIPNILFINAKIANFFIFNTVFSFINIFLKRLLKAEFFYYFPPFRQVIVDLGIAWS